MSSRKLKTFDEKINDVMKKSESSRLWSLDDFINHYSYLEESDVRGLFKLCKEIERYASEVAYRLNEENKGIFAEKQNALTIAISQKYPYLEQVRIQRLISRTLYRLAN